MMQTTAVQYLFIISSLVILTNKPAKCSDFQDEFEKLLIAPFVKLKGDFNRQQMKECKIKIIQEMENFLSLNVIPPESLPDNQQVIKSFIGSISANINNMMHPKLKEDYDYVNKLIYIARRADDITQVDLLKTDKAFELFKNRLNNIGKTESLSNVLTFNEHLLSKFKDMYNKMCDYVIGKVDQSKLQKKVENHLNSHNEIFEQLISVIRNLYHFLPTSDKTGVTKEKQNEIRIKLNETESKLGGNLKTIKASFDEERSYRSSWKQYQTATKKYFNFEEVTNEFLKMQDNCSEMVCQSMQNLLTIFCDQQNDQNITDAVNSAQNVLNGVKQLNLTKPRQGPAKPNTLYQMANNAQETVMKKLNTKSLFEGFLGKFLVEKLTWDDINKVDALLVFEFKAIASIEILGKQYFDQIKNTYLKDEAKQQKVENKMDFNNNDDDKMEFDNSASEQQKQQENFWQKNKKIGIGIGLVLTILIATSGLYFVGRQGKFDIDNQPQFDNIPWLLEETTTWRPLIGINSILIMGGIVLAMALVSVLIFLVYKSNTKKVQIKEIQQTTTATTTDHEVIKKQNRLVKNLVSSNVQMMKTLAAMTKKQQQRKLKARRIERQREPLPRRHERGYPHPRFFPPLQSNISGYMSSNASSAVSSAVTSNASSAVSSAVSSNMSSAKPSAASSLIESKILMPTENLSKVTSEVSKKHVKKQDKKPGKKLKNQKKH